MKILFLLKGTSPSFAGASRLEGQSGFVHNRIRVKWKLSSLRHWVCVRPIHLAFPDAPGSQLGRQYIERLIYAWFARCSELTASKGQIDALLLGEFILIVHLCLNDADLFARRRVHDQC